jgi:hypothetical protein
MEPYVPDSVWNIAQRLNVLNGLNALGIFFEHLNFEL